MPNTPSSEARTTGGLEVSVPEGWRLVEREREGLLVPEADSSGDPWHARVGLAIVVHPAPEAELESYVDGLMKRRVRQGSDDRIETTFDGSPALRSKFTDGVLDIESWFFGHRGAVHEVQWWRPIEYRTETVVRHEEVARLVCRTGIRRTRA